MTTRRPWGENVARIEDAIRRLGPMTRSELHAELKDDNGNLSTTLSRMHRSQRLHVISWVHQSKGARIYPRARYALGPGRDREKPAPDPKAVAARSRDKRKLVASVFDLGLTVKQRLNEKPRP